MGTTERLAVPEQRPRKPYGCAVLLALAGAIPLAALFLYEPRPACVARGTRVSTQRGPRRVEDLRVGDLVLSIDPASGIYVAARIQAIVSALREVTTLQTRGHRLTATLDHPLYDPQSRSYRELRHWCDGSSTDLWTPSNPTSTETVREVATRRSRVRVYDITLDGHLHNFVANGIVVHNKSLRPPPPCTDLRICYPEEAEPKCANPTDCEAQALEAYTASIELEQSDTPSAKYMAYKALDRAGRYMAIAGLEQSPASMRDFDRRIRDLEEEIEVIATEHRIRHHQLKQREMHFDAAQNVRAWQEHFPDTYNVWFKEAVEHERRMKDAGTWPKHLAPKVKKDRGDNP